MKMHRGDKSWYFDSIDKTSPLCTTIDYPLSTKVYMRYPTIDWHGMNVWTTYTEWNGKYSQ